MCGRHNQGTIKAMLASAVFRQFGSCLGIFDITDSLFYMFLKHGDAIGEASSIQHYVIQFVSDC